MILLLNQVCGYYWKGVTHTYVCIELFVAIHMQVRTRCAKFVPLLFLNNLCVVMKLTWERCFTIRIEGTPIISLLKYVTPG